MGVAAGRRAHSGQGGRAVRVLSKGYWTGGTPPPSAAALSAAAAKENRDVSCPHASVFEVTELKDPEYNFVSCPWR